MIKKLYYFLIKIFGDKEKKFFSFLSTHLYNCRTAIDIGCGSNPYIPKYYSFDFICGIDAYYNSCKKICLDKVYSAAINASAPYIPIKERSFDVAILFQVLEHLKKEDGISLIQQIEEIARKLIIITTPNGFVEQLPYDNNPFQEHKSGWTTKDFQKLGYTVYGLEGLKILYKKQSSELIFPKAFWGKIINLGLFEQFIRKRPETAFQLIAIKNLEKH